MLKYKAERKKWSQKRTNIVSKLYKYVSELCKYLCLLTQQFERLKQGQHLKTEGTVSKKCEYEKY